MSSSVQKKLDPNRLFQNLTAWFSGSVAARRKKLWLKHGGKEDDVTNAQFIFSEDVNYHDTVRLFDSEDYLIGCLTVFHAGFIDACINQNSAHKIPASRYLLMPPELAAGLRCVTKQVAEDNDEVVRKKAKRSKAPNRTVTNRENNQGMLSQSEVVQWLINRRGTSTTSSYDRTQEIPHVRDLPSAAGPLYDVVPGQDGFIVQRNF
ncbi:telomere repeats-binding bouquet formation protein 2-like [Amphiura filiformis]|uniref:telomere repeats-binding bouquet formation protein 2-like n=1 Tax=Amphiura filiformis TaxID=82378 RepID=UPI003B213BCF